MDLSEKVCPTTLTKETKECTGSNRDDLVKYCPIDLSWSNWEDWSSCSAPCGPSYRTRIRHCFDGQHGGSLCSNPKYGHDYLNFPR